MSAYAATVTDSDQAFGEVSQIWGAKTSSLSKYPGSL